MKELYFDSWKSESYPYAGITRIRFKGYNLSLAAPHSFQGAKVENELEDARVLMLFSIRFYTFLLLNADNNPPISCQTERSVIVYLAD